ncbi:peroxidase 5-like [Carex rostrata]
MKNKVLLFSFFLLYASIPTNAREIGLGYYKHKGTCSCSDAESIVKSVVEEALNKDRGVGAGLIRLLFHDCFVGGCDGSVLLDESDRNPYPEKKARNNIGLRGFEVIDEAKSRLEKHCPGVVSCADILVFAARDAVEILNGIGYSVTAGRLDSKVSSASEADQILPPPTFDRQQLEDLFVNKKGLTVEDLVVLSGAHTIGRSHCSSFTNRLYPDIDPTLDEDFANKTLRKQCPENAYVDGVVNLDHVTENALDGQYYTNVLDLKTVFFSDWSLLTSQETRDLVVEYATKPGVWEKDFAVSMPKLSNLNVITNPAEGEIRKSCRAVNSYY